MQIKAGGKLLTDFSKPVNMSMIDFSVSKLESTVSGGSTVHFDLTYIGDQGAINQALQSAGEFGDTVTSRELQYIEQNWQRLKTGIKFYRNGKEVVAPW